MRGLAPHYAGDEKLVLVNFGLYWRAVNVMDDGGESILSIFVFC